MNHHCYLVKNKKWAERAFGNMSIRATLRTTPPNNCKAAKRRSVIRLKAIADAPVDSNKTI